MDASINTSPAANDSVEDRCEFLPANFAHRVRDATGVEVPLPDQFMINAIVRGLSATHHERVKAHRIKARLFRDRADAIENVQQILRVELDRDAWSLRAERASFRVDCRHLADELTAARNFCANAHALHTSRFARRPEHYKSERQELWEALFVAWGALLGQKIGPSKRGVCDFVQLASERVSFAANATPPDIMQFWKDDTGRRRRIKAAIAEGPGAFAEYRLFSLWSPD